MLFRSVHGAKEEDSSPKFTTVLLIDGMTCGGCVRTVTNLFKSFDAVDSVAVDLKTSAATISHGVPRLKLLPILTGLDDIGMEAYVAPHYSTGTVSNRPNEISLDDTERLDPLSGTKEKIIVNSGRKLNRAIGMPSRAEKSTTLSLMDELRAGTKPLRRYRCR